MHASRRLIHNQPRAPIGLLRPGLTLFLVFLASAAAAWLWVSLGAAYSLDALIGDAAVWRDHPLALPAVVVLYLLAGLAVVPVTLLIAATGLIFGPLWGALYAAAGVTASAALTHAIGRSLARPVVHRLAGSRIERFLRGRARGGILAVAAVRMLPLAPFTIVNLAFGALHVSRRVFLLGTLLGMAPGIVSIVLLVDRLDAVARRPGADTIGWLAVVLLLIAALAAFSGRQRAAARSGDS